MGGVEFTFSGEVRRSVLFRTHMVHFWRGARWAMALVSVPLAGVIVAWGVAADAHPLSIAIVCAIVVAGYVALVMGVGFGMNAYRAAHFVKQPSFTGTIGGRATHDEFSMDLATGGSQFKWAIFTKIVETPYAAMLYMSNYGYVLVQRDWFGSDAEWNGFCSLAARRLAESRE